MISSEGALTGVRVVDMVGIFDSGSLVPAPGQHDGELPSTLPGLGDSRRQGVIGDWQP